MALASVLWELSGKTGKPVRCVLASYSGRFTVTVTMGENQIESDGFALESDALAHAEFLRADFVRDGWTELYRRDPD